MSPTRLLLIPALLSLSACGGGDDPAAAASGDAPAATSAASSIDWSQCRLPGAGLPAASRLFVVDAGAPLPEAEPGRETIRRVDVSVPGPVALLLTAPDATAWHLRLAPDTQLRAVFASGPQPQRITGQGLGDVQMARSTALGDTCGRYWMDGGAGPALAEASDRVFGRPYDAVYTMQSGSVAIGGLDGATPDGAAPR